MKDAAGDLSKLSPVKRAIIELRETRSKLHALERLRREPIAVIGIGCRYPGGVEDPETFWQLLRDGVDAISEVPADRWDINALYDPDPDSPGKISTRWGGFLEQVDSFDADFFNISPREAVSMDPQQRLLMEVCWEALEHAGQSPATLARSKTGVFVGIGSFDYFQLLLASGISLNIDAYMATGISHSVASGRLSYFLGLQGPCVSLDTACSSSLVAVHLACQSLRNEECHLALAGGVNLILHPSINIALSKARMMAPDGRCKTFDARADGFVRSEGCGVVVLKRFSDAVAQGDTILALIRGSATNQDGRSSGLTAPNGPSQQTVIRDALANAGLEPAQIGYVETHGTGTSLGDPIEVEALAAVMREGRSVEQPLLIGSIKTNLGHAEAAAGIAGLIKVVLSLRQGEIPPHLHLESLNPSIAWHEHPIRIPAARTPWPRIAGRRLAGVSSFGFSGTNAHIILEEAPLQEPEGDNAERPFHLFCVSAKNDRALQALVRRHLEYLETRPTSSVDDVCYTAAVGRGHFDHRAAVVAQSAADLSEKLRGWTTEKAADGIVQDRIERLHPPEVVFLFTGQGSHYVGMGRELYETQPTFRSALERCAELLRPGLDRPLLSVLYPEPGEPSPLHEAAYTQPILFAFEYALAELWRSWGIKPAALMGHSLGEYVAACVAGVFSLEDGLKLVAARGRLIQDLPRVGEMAAVFTDRATVAEAIAPYGNELAIAAENGPQSIVISGARGAVEQVLNRLEVAGIRSKKLEVSHAFHSPLVEPILESMARVSGQVRHLAPRIPLISNVTGSFFGPEEGPDALYWKRHVKEPVKFQAGMESLGAQGHEVFIEVGPSPTLLGMGQRCLPEGSRDWLPSMRKGRGEWQQILESLAVLYVRGVEIDWAGVYRDQPRRQVHLPTYPWQRQRYWSGGSPTGGARVDDEASSVWEAAVSAGHFQSRNVPIDMALDTYPEKWTWMDRLTTAYIARALYDMGAYSEEGQTYSVDEFMDQFQVLPTYRRLIKRWFERLAGEGLLHPQDGRFTSNRPLSSSSPDDLLGEAAEVFADIPEFLEYIQRCGRLLVPILTDRESALETLFPGGTYGTAEFLYHQWALSRYYTAIVRAMIEAVARSLPGDRQLRVIEIGAGTGGTTAPLLPVLPADRTVYYFTDLSEFFFTRAAERFKAYPFLRYGILDIEKSPREQGYGSHDFDLVVAGNVLHATRDLRSTAENTASLLKPGGLLLLYETTRHPSWFDISIGLIEGWQLFDDGLRVDNPLITAARWDQLLRAHGFEHVRVFPEDGSPAGILLQHVLVGQTPKSGAIPQEYAPTAQSRISAGEYIAKEGEAADADTATQAFLSQVRDASPGERLELLVGYVREHVIRVLRRDPTQGVGRHQRLMDLGVDSLMAVELRNVLASGLGLESTLPATLIFDYPNIEAIAGLLERNLIDRSEPEATRPRSSGAAEMGMSENEIAELSDEEVERLLLDKLSTI